MIEINRNDNNELEITEINTKLEKLEYLFNDLLNKYHDLEIKLNNHEECFNELKRKLNNKVEELNNNLLYNYHDLKDNFLNLQHRYDILYKIVSENYPDDIKLYLELADKKEIS